MNNTHFRDAQGAALFSVWGVALCVGAIFAGINVPELHHLWSLFFTIGAGLAITSIGLMVICLVRFTRHLLKR